MTKLDQFVGVCILIADWLAQLDVVMPPVGAANDEAGQMRKWVVESILASEFAYVDVLDVLMQVSSKPHKEQRN